MEYSIRLPAPGGGRVTECMARARDWLVARQDPAGFWCGELEGDTTLESYMILLEAFFGRLGSPKSLDLARTIRDEALSDGGWSQYVGGPAEVSVSCLSYLALKIAGDAADAPHMARARQAIARAGGAERANTYTKYHLALFGQYPWARVPAIPPEMVFLPRASPFTVYDMSAWSRTIFVPLAILYAYKPVCQLPAALGVGELFEGPAGAPAALSPGGLKRLFFGVDAALKLYERVPGTGFLRRAALQRAAKWMTDRLEDSDGLSAILPAMANSAMALKCLGYDLGHPLLAEQLGYLDGLLLRGDDGALRMQPCLSPVWDTVLAGHALAQASHAGRSRVAEGRILVVVEAVPSARRLEPPQRRAAGRLVLRAPKRILSRRGRHLHGAPGATECARARARGRPACGDRTWAHVDAGHAEQRRRLGQLRPRQ